MSEAALSRRNLGFDVRAGGPRRNHANSLRRMLRRRAWLAAAMLFAYFFGTVFYVKTMLRDKGRPGTYASSIAYHAAIDVVAWWLLGIVPGVVGLLLAARAVIVPRLRGPVPTRYVGFGEFGATVLVLVAVLVTV